MEGEKGETEIICNGILSTGNKSLRRTRSQKDEI